jgi:SPP1 family phage portal protein
VFGSDGIALAWIYRTKLLKGTIHEGEVLEDDLDRMVVYTDKEIIDYEKQGKQNSKKAWVETSRVSHEYGQPPIVIWQIAPSYDSRITDDVLGQNDEYNEIDSMTGDDIRVDSDGIIILKGISQEHISENMDSVRMLKAMGLPEGADVSYLVKNASFERAESRLERTREAIHLGLEVPDMESVVGATGATSGIALRIKFLPMIENGTTMIKYIEQSMKGRIYLINAMNAPQGDEVIIEDYRTIISFNLPVNRVEEWQNIGKLDGTVSQKTKLEIFSEVKDVEKEMDRLAAEQADATFIEDNNATPEEAAARTDAVVAQGALQLQPLMGDLIDALTDAVTEGNITDG